MTSDIVFTKAFDRSFARLSSPDQKAVDLAVMTFRRTPKSPGLRLHKLGGAAGFHSISPNLDLRVIVALDGARRVLMYVDHHDAAYAWAGRRRLQEHPVTGSMQNYELPETEETETSPAPAEAPPAAPEATSLRAAPAPLFAAADDATLLAAGLPEAWLPRIRAIRAPDELLPLIDRLPEEAWEALEALSRGETPAARPRREPREDPYETIDARRAFRVVSGEDELRRALERPWPEWAVWLHPGQREAVERDWSGPARVTGQAGTGKSVVAMHRAARHARTGETVLLTTFTKVLAQRLREGVDLLLADDPEARSRITAVHLHHLALDLAGRADAIGDADVAPLLSACRGDLSPAWSDGFLLSEWSSVVDYWGVRSDAAYRAIPRTGRGRPLSAAERDALWRVFEAVRDRLGARPTWADLCERAAERAGDASRFDRVIVDEAQDFGPRELALTAHLCRRGAAGLFFAGDLGQRVYKYPFSWTQIGIDVRGRSRRLAVNYRTSGEIRAFADRMLPTETEAIGGGVDARAAASLFAGPEPEVRACRDRRAEQAALADWIGARRAAGAEPSEIAVLARTRRRAQDALAPVCARLGLARQPLSGAEAGAVYCGTLHGAKGLEFRAVAIVGAEAGQLPLAAALAAETEPEARDAAEARERQLFYVGATRAREALLILHVGPPSPFLPGGEA